MRTRPLLAVLLALAAGCAPTTTAVKPKPSASTAVAATPAPAGVVYTGLATAPSGIVAQGGGNVISGNGSAVISGNGSAIVAQGAGNRRVLASSEKPLVGARVFLADASGQLVAGTQAGQTDAEGRYRLEAPRDGRYLVIVLGANAAGKPVALQTLAFQAGGNLVVSGASTCVAATLLSGRKGDVGKLDGTAFASAVAVVAGKLTDENHPDWADTAAIALFTNGIAELKDILAGMRAQLDQLQQDVNTIKDQLGELLKRSPEPTPTATPTPAGIVTAADGTTRLHVLLTGKLKAKDEQPGKVELLLRSVDSDEKSDSGIVYQQNKNSKPTVLGKVDDSVTFDLGIITLPCKYFLQGVRNETLESYDAIKAKNPDEQQELKLDVHDGVIKLTLKDKTPQFFFLKDVTASVAP